MHETIPHRSLKERQRQEREDLILRVAEEVLLEKGYYETSMDEIAARVGIAKGTLYLHFARKEDLVKALLERGLRAFIRGIEAIVTSEGTAREKLEAILTSRSQGLLNMHPRWFSILSNSDELKPMLFERKEALQAHIHNVVTLINSLLEQGKTDGTFDATIPTPVMRCLFFGMLSPHIYTMLVVDEKMEPEELAYQFKRVYFRAIAAEPGV